MSGLILPGDVLLKVNGTAVSGLANPEEVATCFLQLLLRLCKN
jgi:hypothetical protein